MRFSDSRINVPTGKNIDVQRSINVAVARAAYQLVARIKELLKPHYKTGDLENSWKISEDSGAVVVYSTSPVSVYLDKGTKPKKDIVPTLKKALSWDPEGTFTAQENAEIAADYASDPLLRGRLRRGKRAFNIYEGNVAVKRVRKSKRRGVTGIGYVAAAKASVLFDLEGELADLVGREIADFFDVPFRGAVLSSRTGKFFYGVRGAGGRFAKL